MNVQKLNVILAIGFLSLQIFELFWVPLFILPFHTAYGILLLIPVMLTNSWWAFVHEAIHGTLFTNRTANGILGRINAILFGASFHLLRIGHMLHHALSRTPRERSEVYLPGLDNRAVFTVGYYFRLMGGLYLYELIGGLLFLLPQKWILRFSSKIASEHNVVEFLVERLLKADILPSVRLDEFLALGIYGLAFTLYGKYAWMLALALFARGFLISIMDNVFHYGTPLGKPDISRNLALPTWASRMILNFNFHSNHHLCLSVPWHLLPAVQNQEGKLNKASLIPMLVYQFNGPIPETSLDKLRDCDDGAYA